ncbi:hypothetical protein EDC04DRAFT_3114966 [Pisolithus marmoratus]|nr:hypothetical protein EDC04DRAFT_3114966 [Pisolithus marmoratus]
MALPLQLSYVSLRTALKGIESVDLVLDGGPLNIPKSQGKGAFARHFDEPLTFATEQLTLSVSRKKRRLAIMSEKIIETVTISSADVQSGLQGHEFYRKWDKTHITLGVSLETDTAPTPGISEPPADSQGLQSTTEELIKQCPRLVPNPCSLMFIICVPDSFRILVIGKSGVGKSSLINRVFGVDVASVANDEAGKANIEKEIISPQNDRFILHDSRGFEPAEGHNTDAVRSFIEARKKMPHIKDQLHAVWLCFQIPIIDYGQRLLEEGVEECLERGANTVLRNTPTIVVFTKYDTLLTHMRTKGARDPEAEAHRYLEENCVKPIQAFTEDDNILYVEVSSKPKHERGHKELIDLTYKKVSESFTSLPNTLSPVPFAAAGAQRMVPRVKIESSIDVGKQRYWKFLASSPDFQGYRMLECLRVIHTDIVSAWNFYDPSDYLYSVEFRDLMTNMAGLVDRPAASASPSTHPTRSDTFSQKTVPLVAAVLITLPFVAGLALVQWAHETYQRLQNAHLKFMAYIVDLTHVLEILFALTASRKVKKLTRTAIKLAFNAYYNSTWMREVHSEITSVEHSMVYRDVILEKITSLLPLRGTGAKVSAALEGRQSVDQERDEEWHGAGDG